MIHSIRSLFCFSALVLLALCGSTHAQRTASLADVLSDSEWSRLEKSVDKALAYLSKQQAPDGSFRGNDVGQPAITSLGIMAYLSRGHQPGSGPYGKQLERAIDYVLSTQRRDGLFTRLDAPGPRYIPNQPDHTATYNHAIAGLMLGEMYGMCTGQRSEQVRRAIEQALIFTWRLQAQKKDKATDKGGWRYIHDRDDRDSDISVTGWHLMFLRSAKNAEFDVPKVYVDAAVGFVKRCYVGSKSKGTFSYYPGEKDKASLTMTCIGTLSLALGGLHRDPLVLEAADWMLDDGVEDYGDHKRWHYRYYYYVQAMAQVGGEHWKKTFPKVLKELVNGQKRDGSWDGEGGKKNPSERFLGDAYFTSLGVLTLTPPYQLLPLYQR
jgi:prenyltransferase beta subunit